MRSASKTGLRKSGRRTPKRAKTEIEVKPWRGRHRTMNQPRLRGSRICFFGARKEIQPPIGGLRSKSDENFVISALFS
ncbi:MAG: hypothetical protein DMG31_10920 [Acidobacteria bacterium]|nr:MAG: hypothetical protein DMG31_10920 [Acidobacteriota bacterium]